MLKIVPYRNTLMTPSIPPAPTKALSILALLGAGRDLDVAELARNLGMNKSSVFRLLKTLVHKGYLEKNPLSDQYRLSYALFAIAYAAADRYGLKDVAARVMATLATEVRKGVNLGVLDRGAGPEHL
jgi:IclR family KDG regulon transcriptional repressor